MAEVATTRSWMRPDPSLSRRELLQMDASWAGLAGGVTNIALNAAAELEAMADGAPAGRRKLRELATRLRAEIAELRDQRLKAAGALAELKKAEGAAHG
ncbi:hypothetical protein [Xanthobacter aminoxidans]|uniref:hypothetical protein n=1 Tax=Xanthobacter aminoxidans TaxID=186280 RepID=UPI0020231890|nr:hypothetical protein [Xanthobacter aminoxidans]MCL8385501.1 hypothetical protein [Xanthobacter aminoxidans]